MSARQQTPVVWLITDNKPGHRNQLKGLGDRLAELINADIFWVNANDYQVPLSRVLLGKPPAMDGKLPPPELIIAAGSSTHRLLLALRKIPHASKLVLMKPAFPINWIDGAIIPAHDRVQPSPNVLVTEGALNAVEPLNTLTDAKNALVLIGGPSPHFAWDSQTIFEQVRELITHYPQWHWQVTDSRRTPAGLAHQLEDLHDEHTVVTHHQQTPDGWLNQQLAQSRAAWVTPDSLSMVCEAATSGVPTGLLQLPPQKNSRVAAGVKRLVGQGFVFEKGQPTRIMGQAAAPQKTLWEADRAARWVIDHFLPEHFPGTQERNV